MAIVVAKDAKRCAFSTSWLALIALQVWFEFECHARFDVKLRIPTLTRRSLQLPHPRRDFLCALIFRLISFSDEDERSIIAASRDDRDRVVGMIISPPFVKAKQSLQLPKAIVR